MKRKNISGTTMMEVVVVLVLISSFALLNTKAMLQAGNFVREQIEAERACQEEYNKLQEAS